jgi:DtxR family Mn-dependent transcriptional regulator
MITDVEAKYLMALYEMSMKGEEFVGPKKMAEIMNVKRPTAYEVLNKLASHGFVNKKDGKYGLTENGKIIAQRVIRNHRVIETLLYNIGVELERACSIASRIQVELDDDVVDLLCNYLGNPKECPHGRPIPEVTVND